MIDKRLLVIFIAFVTFAVYAEVQYPYHASKIVEIDSGGNIIENSGQNVPTDVFEGAFEYYYRVFSQILTDEDLNSRYLYKVFSNKDDNWVGGKNLSFLEEFRVGSINKERRQVKLFDGNEFFTVSFSDFNRQFIWQNQMVDSQRMYMPLIGFTSVDAQSVEDISIKRGPSASARDYSDRSLFQYDAYKILDYQGGYFLIAELGDLRFNRRAEESGIIGWVPEEFVVFWIGRRYQKITDIRYLDHVVYGNGNYISTADRSLFSNLYIDTENYIEQHFPKNIDGEQTLKDRFKKFYQRGGAFYSGRTRYNRNTQITTHNVTLFNNFDQQILTTIANRLIGDVRVHFLIDRSSSTRQLAQFCEYFIETFQNDPFFPRNSLTNSIFSYLEKIPNIRSNIRRHDNFNQIRYGEDMGDLTYTENLLPSLRELMESIETDETSQYLLKTVFIVTDAGDNNHFFNNYQGDLNRIVDLAKEKGINLIFLIPSMPPAIDAPARMRDSPASAYRDLMNIINSLSQRLNTQPNYRIVDYKVITGDSFRDYALDTVNSYKNVVTNLRSYDTNEERIPVFSEHLPEFIRNSIHNRNISLYRTLQYQGGNSFFQNRIAIDKRLFKSLINMASAQRLPAEFNENLKKSIVINNLYGIDSFDRVDQEWRKLESRFRQYNQNLNFNDTALYNALTGQYVMIARINSNLSSVITQLDQEERDFSFNVSSRDTRGTSEYIYLLQSEVFNQ